MITDSRKEYQENLLEHYERETLTLRRLKNGGIILNKKSMITFNKIVTTSILHMLSIFSYSQQRSYDIVSYTAPNSWTETLGNGNVSYSRIENGNWAQITIYKSTASTGNIDADFDKDWNELVVVNKNISSPQKTKPQPKDDWAAMSGSGTWQYNGVNVTSQLTVYSNSKVCISILCNFTTNLYLKDYQTVLASVFINPGNAQLNLDTIPPQNGGSFAVTNKNSVVGIWIVNQAETRGFSNGHLMYSGGYMRKEYQIKEDGTYIFREKNWLANNEIIYFVYESGTWTMDGNKLTITPKKGKAGWWHKDKITNDVNKWGNYQKAAAYKIQSADYIFEIKAESNYNSSIILNCSKATERDGGQLNNSSYRFVYVQRKESLIDNPPGFKF